MINAVGYKNNTLGILPPKTFCAVTTMSKGYWWFDANSLIIASPIKPQMKLMKSLLITIPSEEIHWANYVGLEWNLCGNSTQNQLWTFGILLHYFDNNSCWKWCNYRCLCLWCKVTIQTFWDDFTCSIRFWLSSWYYRGSSRNCSYRSSWFLATG